jgi:hypothetical protein
LRVAFNFAETDLPRIGNRLYERIALSEYEAAMVGKTESRQQ